MPPAACRRQFRKAGPMILPNATPEDLDLLRGAVDRNEQIIQMIAFHRIEDGRDYRVFAHANEKISVAAWKDAIHKRLENVQECEDIKAALAEAWMEDTFEQVGNLITRMRKIEPAVKKVETRSVGTQTDPADLAAPAVSGKKRSIASIFEKTEWEKAGHVDHCAEFERSFVLEKDRIKEKSPYMQSIYRDLGPERYPYLTSRKVFLTMQGIEVPEDYDLSLERSREFENELRRKREAEDALKVREPSTENKKPKLSQDLDCEDPSES